MYTINAELDVSMTNMVLRSIYLTISSFASFRPPLDRACVAESVPILGVRHTWIIDRWPLLGSFGGPAAHVVVPFSS